MTVLRFLSSMGAIALAVLTYSGQMKSLPYMGWIPIDLTVLTAAIVVGCSAILFFFKTIQPSISAPLGLWACFLIPAFTVATNGYGTQKLLTLFTFTLITVIAPFFLLQTERQGVTFLGTLVVLSCFVGVTSFQNGALDSLTGSTFDDINPISLSRMMGTGLVILVIFAFARDRRMLWRVLMLVMACGLLVVIFASGRRGPVLAVIVGITVAFAFAPAFSRHRIRTILSGLVALAIAGRFAISSGSAGSERVLSFFVGEEDASTTAREQIWNQAIDIAKSNPFGVGWASFPQHSDLGTMVSDSGRMYPHNIFLEGFVEGGWLVGSILLVFVVLASLRLRRLATTQTLSVFLGILGFTLTNAMVSGDINDQKLMWVALGLAFALRRETSESTQRTGKLGQKTIAIN
ncbi:O-antigen ligase family protein [Glutamicibacter nicotianae]|uniref:O-antigen ligase family protein n=1 Tax=Glutamicibacter nicotianae TaxID=37929 RepID=UPI00255327AC|nr:O-antigen ligase family protein [Glutamicibacter nicotianae]WIV45303.1 O-antigen ligase family protein [Glutamicibacter nicotianae]